MAALIVALALLALVIAAGVAAVTDRTPDTRDPDFGIGPVLQPYRNHAITHCDR
jgi:hypothetical protein